jgi:hypothetical protein
VETQVPDISAVFLSYRHFWHEKDYKGFPVERNLDRGFLLLALPLPALREKVKDCGTTNGHRGPIGPDPDERRARGPRSNIGIEFPVLFAGMPRAGPTRFTGCKVIFYLVMVGWR